MAKDIMEHIGFLQVIELVGPPDEIACDKRAIGKMIEKHVVGNQAGHGNKAPSGRCRQPFGQFGKVGNAGLRQLQHIDAAQEGFGRAAGQHRRLSREQCVPSCMVLRRIMFPRLRDDPVAGDCHGCGIHRALCDRKAAVLLPFCSRR